MNATTENTFRQAAAQLDESLGRLTRALSVMGEEDEGKRGVLRSLTWTVAKRAVALWIRALWGKIP